MHRPKELLDCPAFKAQCEVESPGSSSRRSSTGAAPSPAPPSPPLGPVAALPLAAAMEEAAREAVHHCRRREGREGMGSAAGAAAAAAAGDLLEEVTEEALLCMDCVEVWRLAEASLEVLKEEVEKETAKQLQEEEAPKAATGSRGQAGGHQSAREGRGRALQGCRGPQEEAAAGLYCGTEVQEGWAVMWSRKQRPPSPCSRLDLRREEVGTRQ